MDTTALKKELVKKYPLTKVKDWKRESKLENHYFAARVFSNKVTGQEELTRVYHSDGRLEMEPYKVPEPPPGGMSTWEEIASGRCKIIRL